MNSPILSTVCIAWKDIGFYCMAEVHEYYMDFKVYSFYLWQTPEQTEWDGVSDLKSGQAPSGCAFDKKDAAATPDPVVTVEQSQVFLSGFIKWDHCTNLRFDTQDESMLHFCDREQMVNVGGVVGTDI